MAKSSKVSKFFKNLLTVLLVVIILCTLGLNLIFKDDNSAPFIFGNGFYIMQQVNMLDVSYGDVVISDKNKISEIQPGNVVLCLTSYDDFKEVLRVQEIVQEDGVTYYMVKSDDPEDQSRKLSVDKIIAKCTYTNSILGKLISFVKSWQGIAVLVGGSGIILVLIHLTNYANKREEERREELEEEQRRAKANQNRNRPRRPNPNNTNNNGEHRPRNNENPNRPKNVNPNRTAKNSNGQNSNNGAVKPHNKPISVTQLSEEESIKQRENISNMIGSELTIDTQAKEITREFNSAEVVVSQPTNLEAIKIHESKPSYRSSESVHSPNMEQKAVEIKKALSQTEVDDLDAKPVMANVKEETPQSTVSKQNINKEPIKPIEPIKPVETVEEPKSQSQKINPQNNVTETKPPVKKQAQPKREVVDYNSVTDTVIVIPQEFDKAKKKEEPVSQPKNEPKVEVEKVEKKIETKIEQPVQNRPTQPSQPVKKSVSKPTPKPVSKTANIDKLINDDDNFLDNLFEEKNANTNSNVKISDDILDELLSTIPSTHPVEKSVERIKPEIKKPVHKTTTKKSSHKSTVTHKSVGKKVDNTSFDELIKAIEHEKNSNNVK